MRQTVNPPIPSVSQIQNMADKTIPDKGNTDDFLVVEQNSQKVNINDIAQMPEVSGADLILSKDDGLNTVKAFISAGKKFSDAVVRSRNTGRKFMRVMGLIVNIQTNPEQITHTDLTKQRMMALCHKILFQSGSCNDFSSPLVGRINFHDDNPLTKIKPLIGAGFQFLGQVVISSYRKEDHREGVLLFHLGCMALDYIRKTSPSYDSDTGVTDRPVIDPNRLDFSDYTLTDEADEGEVFVAGCRNLDQSSLSILGTNANASYHMVSRVSIGRFGGSVTDRVAKNFSSIARDMRRTLTRVDVESQN